MIALYEGFYFFKHSTTIGREEYDFDPYKPRVTTLTGYKELKSEEYQVDPIQKEIEAEKEKRKLAAQTPIKDREIKVFKIDPNQKICKIDNIFVTHKLLAAGMEFLERKDPFAMESSAMPEEAEAGMQYMRLKKENEEAQMVSHRAAKKLQKLKKTPMYTKGYIRFKFPDMYILQAAFSPSETMTFVYQFLRDVPFYPVPFRRVEFGKERQRIQSVHNSSKENH